jgi:hypothetical protein
MRQMMRLAILGVAVLVVGAMIQPAQAACSNALVFSSTGSLNGFSQFSYVETAGVPSGSGVDGSKVSANLRGNFWNMLNSDIDDSPTPGSDDGGWPAIENGLNLANGPTGWMLSYAGDGFPGAMIAGTWAQDPRIDGCPDTTATEPDCHAIVLTDHTGSDTYFAIISKQEAGDANYDLSLPGNATIVLQPLPKPRITGSSRTGNDVTLQIGAPLPGDLSAGSYLDGACPAVLTHYKVRGRIVPRGSGVGAGRDPAQWNSFETADIPIGNGTSLLVDCSEVANQDVYIAQTLKFEGGFELTYVSRESTRAECGPQIAQPQQPTRERPGRR